MLCYVIVQYHLIYIMHVAIIVEVLPSWLNGCQCVNRSFFSAHCVYIAQQMNVNIDIHRDVTALATDRTMFSSLSDLSAVQDDSKIMDAFGSFPGNSLSWLEDPRSYSYSNWPQLRFKNFLCICRQYTKPRGDILWPVSSINIPLTSGVILRSRLVGCRTERHDKMRKKYIVRLLLRYSATVSMVVPDFKRLT